jgi:hypothetical protein
MNRRVGQANGLNKHLPSRPLGSVALYCPACPEPGVNMEEDTDYIPDELRYVLSF